MLATIGIGIWSGRGREKSLDERSVSGRGLGFVFILLLMAGETYTSFSFLGTAGWSYSYGVPILYLIGYLSIGLVVAYLVGPLFWTYAARHKLVSLSDIVEHRFRSRGLAILVAVLATIFIVPYIQLQIQGMGAVVNAMSYGAIDLKIAAIVSFIVAEAFILFSGLRGSAWVSVLKDGLVILAVAFLAIYVPLHYFDGLAPLLDRVVSEKSQWLTFPGAGDGIYGVCMVHLDDHPQRDHDHRVPHFDRRLSVGHLGECSATQLDHSAVVSAAAPRADDGRSGCTLRRPCPQRRRLGPVLRGHRFAARTDRRNHRRRRSTVRDRADERVHALDRLDVGTDRIGRRLGRTEERPSMTPEQLNARGLRQKTLSQWVCLAVGIIALIMSLLMPDALVELSVLSYEGLAQVVPAALLSLYWPRMSKQAAAGGLVVGSVVMVALHYTGLDPLLGINGGLWAVAANLIVVVSHSGQAGPTVGAVSSGRGVS